MIDSDFEGFKLCIESCDPVQLQHKRSPFTGWNRIVRDDCIVERLEITLISVDFQEHFSHTKVENLPTGMIMFLCYL